MLLRSKVSFSGYNLVPLCSALFLTQASQLLCLLWALEELETLELDATTARPVSTNLATPEESLLEETSPI